MDKVLSIRDRVYVDIKVDTSVNTELWRTINQTVAMWCSLIYEKGGNKI